MYLKERPPIYAFKKAFLLLKKKEFPNVLSCFVKCIKNLIRSIKILYFILILYFKYKLYIINILKNTFAKCSKTNYFSLFLRVTLDFIAVCVFWRWKKKVLGFYLGQKDTENYKFNAPFTWVKQINSLIAVALLCARE